jgi:hypothetical protein
MNTRSISALWFFSLGTPARYGEAVKLTAGAILRGEPVENSKFIASPAVLTDFDGRPGSMWALRIGLKRPQSRQPVLRLWPRRDAGPKPTWTYLLRVSGRAVVIEVAAAAACPAGALPQRSEFM